MRARQLTVLNPCPESWDSMEPAGNARRFCARCSQHVHFLSAITEAEADRLVAEAEAKSERLCVRYLSTLDGEMLFRPALVSAPSRALVMLAGLGALLSACTEPQMIAVDDEVCVHDQMDQPDGSARVERGHGDCPARIEEPGAEPPLWIELEPAVIIPELELPDEPETSPRKGPASRVAPRKVMQDKKTKILFLDMGGTPLGW